MGNFERLVLPNGLRVMLEEVPNSPSVSINLTICRGSRDEPGELGGITHFIEHMLFKGTVEHDLYQIAREINLQGGMMNALTNTDLLRLYTRVVADDVSAALDLMAEMIWRSTMPDQEILREKGVVLEEIAESNDSPEDLCFENFLKRLWEPHPLGRPVLGTEETVSAFSRDLALEYWEGSNSPRDIVLSMAGGLKIDEAGELARRVFGDRAPGKACSRSVPAARPNGGRVTVQRDLEQVQFCLGVESFGRGDDRRFALALFDTILGGGMGSRLFNEVREKRGLAYTIASNAQALDKEGYMVIYGGTSVANMEEVHKVCEAEVHDLCDRGPTPEELSTACHQIERAYLLSLESTGTKAAINADVETYGVDRLTPEEVIGRLHAVTVEEVQEVGRQLFGSTEMAVSLVGPVVDSALPGVGVA